MTTNKVRTADAGKPAARVAAVQIALYDILDRPEEAVFLLEAALVFGQELIEVVEQHPIKDSPLRMSVEKSKPGSDYIPRRKRPF